MWSSTPFLKKKSKLKENLTLRAAILLSLVLIISRGIYYTAERNIFGYIIGNKAVQGKNIAHTYRDLFINIFPFYPRTKVLNVNLIPYV